MSGIRQVRDFVTVDVSLSQPFAHEIPEHFWADEPYRERMECLWKDFQESANKIRRSSCSAVPLVTPKQTRRYRKATFVACMDNLCKDFSRRTETIKVQFIDKKNHSSRSNHNNNNNHNNNTKSGYKLKLVKLSAIPENCRNIQIWNAEVPSPELQVFAEFVSYGDYDEDGYRQPVRVVVAQGVDDTTTEGAVVAAEDYVSLPCVEIRGPSSYNHCIPQQQQQQALLLSLPASPRNVQSSRQQPTPDSTPLATAVMEDSFVTTDPNIPSLVLVGHRTPNYTAIQRQSAGHNNVVLEATMVETGEVLDVIMEEPQVMVVSDNESEASQRFVYV